MYKSTVALLTAALAMASEVSAGGPLQELERPNGLIPRPLTAAELDNSKKTKNRMPAPIGEFYKWITETDYPTRALREDRQGIVIFQVTVGLDGRIKNCEITISSGSSDLDSTVCEIWTERGRFRPALDAEGKPTIGKFPWKYHWTLPD